MTNRFASLLQSRIVVVVGATALPLLALAMLTPKSPSSSTVPAPTVTEQSVEPAVDRNHATYSGQLLSDYKVGEILGEIKCGKRPVQDSIDYLNVNGVPPALLQNHTPEVAAGFQRATTWC